jgi:hypothetical protein
VYVCVFVCLYSAGLLNIVIGSVLVFFVLDNAIVFPVGIQEVTCLLCREILIFFIRLFI